MVSHCGAHQSQALGWKHLLESIDILLDGPLLHPRQDEALRRATKLIINAMKFQDIHVIQIKPNESLPYDFLRIREMSWVKERRSINT